MYALLITIAVLLTVSATTHLVLGWSQTWSFVSGIVAALAVQVAIGFWVRKQLTSVITAMQFGMQTAANELRMKYENLARRGGNTKTLMAQAEREQNAMLKDAIDTIELLRKYKHWTFMLDRQIATMQFQFYYQMKDFKTTDELLSKVIVGEPVSACMKMARCFATENTKELEKTYKSAVKKFKGNGALVYATMSWIHLKNNHVDAAIKVLIDGKTNTMNETLIQNLQLLQNGKNKQFSNASFGEHWYALFLEQPKQMQQPAHSQAIHPMHRQMMAAGMRRR